MNIIQKTPNPSGAYPPIQSWSGESLPEGYYQVANGVTLSCGGFGTLTLTNGIVTDFMPNTAAWEAWQAEHKPPVESQISALKTQLSATDYKAIKYAEGWITEADYAPIKAERQAIRDQINALEASET